MTCACASLPSPSSRSRCRRPPPPRRRPNMPPRPDRGRPARRRQRLYDRQGRSGHAFQRAADRQGRQGRQAAAGRRQAARMARFQARRPRPHAAARPDRRAWPHHGSGLRAYPCRSQRHHQPRRRANQGRRLCREPSQSGVGRRLRLEPGELAPRPLPDGRRHRHGGARSAGRARAGRWSCAGRQFGGDGGGGDFGLHQGCTRRPYRARRARPPDGRVRRAGQWR